jgi:hypothetical protein
MVNFVESSLPTYTLFGYTVYGYTAYGDTTYGDGVHTLFFAQVWRVQAFRRGV